jgi:hypothetical protein
MEFKYFCFQNSEHISGARKQNDRDDETSRHGSDQGPIGSRHGVGVVHFNVQAWLPGPRANVRQIAVLPNLLPIKCTKTFLSPVN